MPQQPPQSGRRERPPQDMINVELEQELNRTRERLAALILEASERRERARAKALRLQLVPR